MIASAFLDASRPPSEAELRAALGAMAGAWDRLEGEIAAHGSLRTEWKSYSKASGWCRKFLLGDKARNIAFAYPGPERIVVVLVYSESAAAAAAAGGYRISERTRQALADAKRHAEGLSISYELRPDTSLDELVDLIRLKVEH